MKATATNQAPDLQGEPPGSVSARIWLSLILLVSVALRIQLAAQGGQGYWPDELRYETTRQAVTALCNGDWPAAGERLLGSSDHILFRFIGLVPALLERALFPADAIPPGFAAGFFGLFGVGTIGLVWLIARRETGGEATATWCALFYAGCVTAFFFGRHYFPYDPAICLLLFGWWQGLRSRTSLQHWATGALVGLGYLTYNAYWNFGAVILIFHTLRPRHGQPAWIRAAWAALGLISPIVLLFATARVLGHDLIAHTLEFSHTVTHGGFGHGGNYILSYFAAAEGFYGAFLLLLAVTGLFFAVRKHAPEAVWWWPAMAGLLVAEMVFFSDVVPRFALSGRMVKPLAIFLALNAGLAAGLWGVHRSRWIAAGVSGLAVVLAAVNFRTPLTLVFPRDFRLQAEVRIAEERRREPSVALQMYYADFMHLAHFITAYPPHVVLLQRTHPLQYRPYQFEGFDAPTRQAFQGHDFSMRLVRLTEPTGWQTDFSRVGTDLRPYAGTLEIELDLPNPRPAGHTEPLVVAGSPGRADLLSIHYLDAERIEILVDHWGWGAVRSAPFRLPPTESQRHRVTVCAGFLLPPVTHPSLQQDRDLQVLAAQVVVMWNDRLVMRETLPSYPSPALGVTVGGNYVGGTTTEIEFTGRIHGIRQIDPRLAMRRDWGAEVSESDGASPARGRGPLLVAFLWDDETARRLTAEAALVTARRDATTAMVTMRSDGASVVFSTWADGQRLAESAPLQLPAGRHQLELWAPLLALSQADRELADPMLAAWLLGNSLLKLDGHTLLHTSQPAPVPAAGTATQTYITIGRPGPLDPTGTTRRFPGKILSASVEPAAGPVLLNALWRARISGNPTFAEAVGPLRLKVKLPSGRAGTREPLLASGRPGVADVIFVSYEDDGTVRIGHDHWGWQLLMSGPLRLDPTREHIIDLSFGSLYPAEDTPWARAPHTPLSRVGQLYVAINGRPVLHDEREFYLAPSSSVTVGQSLVGASTCAPSFTGEVIQITHLDPATELPSDARLAPSPGR